MRATLPGGMNVAVAVAWLGAPNERKLAGSDNGTGPMTPLLSPTQRAWFSHDSARSGP